MPRSTAGEPAGAQLTELFFLVGKQLRDLVIAHAGSLGLAPAQGRALRTIGLAGRPLRVAELAERLCVVPRSATSVADSLERAGLLTRATSTEDRRVVLLSLTPAGRRTCRRIEAAERAAGEQLFGRLTTNDREALERVLHTLIGRGT